MTHYQKKWLNITTVLAVVLAGSLIWAGLTANSSQNIDVVLGKCDTTTVENISIIPYYPDDDNNLTTDTVVVTRKEDVNNLLYSLKSAVEKHFPKGARTKWHTYLVVHFTKEFKNDLKDPSKLIFHIYDSEAGLYLERLNVMGYAAYSSNDLKAQLKKLTNFK